MTDAIGVGTTSSRLGPSGRSPSWSSWRLPLLRPGRSTGRLEARRSRPSPLRRSIAATAVRTVDRARPGPRAGRRGAPAAAPRRRHREASSGSAVPDSRTIAWSSSGRTSTRRSCARHPAAPTDASRRDRDRGPPSATAPEQPSRPATLSAVRIAVLSDIHGNLPALEAVLAALSPYDAIWQLGDVVGYGPEPDAVVARLARAGRRPACVAITMQPPRRARDQLSSTARRGRPCSGRRRSSRPETRDWLTALPETAIEGDYTLAHGSPRDPALGVRPDDPDRARQLRRADDAAARSSAIPTCHSSSARTMGSSRRSPRRTGRCSPSTNAGRCSIRAASASLVTVIRGPVAPSWTRTRAP